MTPFQKHIDNLRVKSGFTKKGLSEKAGLDASSLRKILSGDGSLKVDTLVKLSNALGVYASEMLPVEWQKPTQKIDFNLFESILTELLTEAEEIRQQFTPREAALSAVLMYNKQVSEKQAKIYDLKHSKV